MYKETHRGIVMFGELSEDWRGQDRSLNLVQTNVDKAASTSCLFLKIAQSNLQGVCRAFQGAF